MRISDWSSDVCSSDLNDGRLRATGRFGTSAQDVRNLARDDMREAMDGWKKKRVLLYAHGGLVPEESEIQRVADYREAMLAQQIYPLCSDWKTDFWTTRASSEVPHVGHAVDLTVTYRG